MLLFALFVLATSQTSTAQYFQANLYAYTFGSPGCTRLLNTTGAVLAGCYSLGTIDIRIIDVLPAPLNVSIYTSSRGTCSGTLVQNFPTFAAWACNTLGTTPQMSLEIKTVSPPTTRPALAAVFVVSGLLLVLALLV